MIDGIRRRFAKSIDKDPWDTEQQLEPDVEAEESEASVLPTDTAVILAATRLSPSTTNDVDSGEYYKNILKTAIQNGGKYGEHQIPIPWLRMILAGLEWKHIDSEMMWYGFDATSPGTETLPEIPSYEDLFPADRDSPTGPGLN